MSQVRSEHISAMDSPPRPLSADCIEPAENSMLYAMLPSAVQSRLPRLPSLRKSVSIYAVAVSRKSRNDAASRPSTPPPGYTSATALSRSDMMDSRVVEMSEFYATQQLEHNLGASKTQSQPLEMSEVQSGIGWKFANQGISIASCLGIILIYLGLNLLGLAIEESAAISQEPSSGNAPFSRQLYVHSLTYLLRGLPSDLTPDEQMSVRVALPNGIVEPLQVGSINTQTSSPQISPQPPSLLHKTLATTIVQIFVMLQFLIPYVKYLLASAYQYERTHRISEKILRGSMDAVDSVGKRSLTLTGAIYTMVDGKIGQLVQETGSWLVEGVTGGIHEGVGEGLAIMGAKKQDQ